MSYHSNRLRLPAGVILTLCVLLSACCVMAAELDREAAATVLYKAATQKLEAALLSSVVLSEECLSDYNQIIIQYPDTEIARWAEMRYASCLMYAQSYDQAAEACQEVVDDYPGELVAAWAQFYQGQALEKSKKYGKAAEAFLDVEKYAGLADQNPVDYARHCAGRMFLDIELRDGFDSALHTCGISKNNDRQIAWVLLIRAIARADGGEFGFAEYHLNEIKNGFSNQRDFLCAAQAEVGAHMLDFCDREPKSSQAASYEAKGIGLLNAAKQSVGLRSFVGSKASLRLAQYQMDTKRDLVTAENILKEMQSQAPECEMAKEARYRLAQCLNRQEKYAEAAELFGVIRQSDPLSGWAESAGYMQGACLAASGDTEKAKVILDSVMNSDTASQAWRASARKQLTSIYLETGDKDRASDLLRDELAVLRQCIEKCADAEVLVRLSKAADTLSKQLEKLTYAQGGTK